MTCVVIVVFTNSQLCGSVQCCPVCTPCRQWASGMFIYLDMIVVHVGHQVLQLGWVSPELGKLHTSIWWVALNVGSCTLHWGELHPKLGELHPKLGELHTSAAFGVVSCSPDVVSCTEQIAVSMLNCKASGHAVQRFDCFFQSYMHFVLGYLDGSIACELLSGWQSVRFFRTHTTVHLDLAFQNREWNWIETTII